MLPLSPEPMRSSTGNSIESVEQPWDSGFICVLRVMCRVQTLSDSVEPVR